MADDQLFYVGQKALIRKGDAILVLRDAYGTDLPGGKIQIGEEHLENALHREITEETGLIITVDKPFATGMWKIREPHLLAGARIFYVVYLADYVSGEMVLSDEHETYEWVTKDTYQKHQSDDDIYRAIEAYFLSL